MGRCDLCLEGSLHLGQRRVFVEGGAAEPDRLRRAREQSRSGGHQHRVERDGGAGVGGPVSPPCSSSTAPLSTSLIPWTLIFFLLPSSTITTPSYCLIGGVIYERARKLLLLVALAVLAATDAHEHLPCGGNQHQLAQHGCDSSSTWRAGTRAGTHANACRATNPTRGHGLAPGGGPRHRAASLHCRTSRV